jgi:hypothetical protein
LDIGFLENGDLDVYALMNHVGAENLITWSEDFSNPIWSKVNSTLLPNTIVAPDGARTADKLIALAGSINHYSGYNVGNIIPPNVTGTYSFFAKAGEESIVGLGVAGGITFNANYNLLSGTVSTTGVSATITPVEGGWFYCTMTATPTSYGHSPYFTLRGTQVSYEGDGFSGLYLWGVQLNTGPVALDYCRTTSTPLTSGQNFCANSEGDVTTLGSTSGISDAVTGITGFAASLQFVSGADRWAYRTAFFAVTGRTYSFGVVVQMDDNSIPVFGDNSAASDGQLKISGVFASGASVVALGGGQYLVHGTVVCAGQNLDQTGIVKWATNSTKGFRITAYRYNDGSTLLPYKSTTTAILDKGSGFVTRMYDQSGNARDLTQAATANQPRIAFAGSIERVKVAENLLAWSEDFSNAAWGKRSGILVTPNTGLGADGALTADLVTWTSNDGYIYVSPISFQPSTTYTFSIYAKKSSGSPTLRLQSWDGLVSRGSATFVLSDELVRYIFTFTTSTSIGFSDIGPYVVNGSALIWGAQLNTGSTARTYCRTAGAPVTLGDTHHFNKPGYRTDGVSQFMQTANFVVPQPFTRSSVLQFLANTGEFIGTANGINVPLFFYGAGNLVMYSSSPGVPKSFKAGINPGSVATISEIFDTVTSLGSYNGVTTNTTGNGVGEHNALTVGRTLGGIGNAIFSDIVLFAQALSTADRLDLELNQKSYYRTP